MKYGISEIPVIPVRKENREQSEQVTQLLFGETFEILEEKVSWSYIKVYLDNYEGWINSDSITYLNETDFLEINDSEIIYTNQISSKIYCDTKQEYLNLPFGSSLPNFNYDSNCFTINSNSYRSVENFNNSNIEMLTNKFLNSPYLWGGKNPYGIDCSGFTQVIYKSLNFFLPRDAKEQVNLGNTINFLMDTKPGDLAFFDNEENEITHVGIILDSNKIIHASVKVRIDQLDQQGIYNKEKHKYTHKLRIIKRIIE